MTANEIADLLDQATAVIKKQQAEIEALKKEAALQRLSDFTQEVEANYGITTKWDGITTYHETTEPIGKVKELTDEEIDELANKYLYVLNDVPYANDIKDFARAILRKAQEK